MIDLGLLVNMKAQKAHTLHGKGDLEQARRLYEEAYQGGLDNPRYLLSYTVLLFRAGEFEKACEVLRRTEKVPGINAEQKAQVFVYYASCVFKMGQIDKGIRLLEKQHLRQPSGLVYQTLGILNVEKYDASQKPDFKALDEEAMKAWETARAAALEPAEDANEDDDEKPSVPDTPPRPSEEVWNEGIEKAKAFLEEAVDYDDEDPICLDNYAQFLYRVLGDRENARKYFKKAIEIKPTQIDTLYFLAQYDIAEGKPDAAKEKLATAREGRFSPLNYSTPEKVDALLSSISSGKEA